MAESSTEETPWQLELDPSQQHAVSLCVDPKLRLVSVTGSAGTGKTTILRRAYNLLAEAGYKVALCSPTGKAAKRIQEVTGIPAFTIHRLLEYSHPGDPDPKTGKPLGVSFPQRHRLRPLEYDVVFADEYAMVNRSVHAALMAAIPSGGAIRMFGDANQLRPIEDDEAPVFVQGEKVDPRSPFEQLLANPRLASARLTTIYRQAEDSGILLNLQLILKGQVPTRNAQWDMRFTDMHLRALEEVLNAEMAAGHNFASIDNQVITLQHNGNLGTTALNKILKRKFNPAPDKAAPIPRNKWRVGDDGSKGTYTVMGVGDKVIVTRNIYGLDLMNGETGIIIDITPQGELVIDFGNKEQVVPPVMQVLNRWGKMIEIDPRKDIDLAYAITTHKSQGSEYQRVIYALGKPCWYMASRRNFYTAASRGKQHVTVITDQPTLRKALVNKE